MITKGYRNVASIFPALWVAWGSSVASYRCYFMSGDAIQAVQVFECADDAAVVSKASALLDAKPQHPAIEIWQGKRFIARLARNAPATS